MRSNVKFVLLELVIINCNPIKYFLIDKLCSTGLLWRVYKATKKSTKQEAAIFEFQKKQLDKYGKDDQQQMLELIRRGVIQLTKIRHPQVLTVQHQLEESRDSIAFATEPVFASLANILGNHHNMPQPHTLGSYKLHDVDTKYGLIQSKRNSQWYLILFRYNKNISL